MKVNRKVIYLCVLTVEMVLLGLLCLERLKSHENDRIEYSADMLMMAQENEGVLEMRDGTPYIDGAVDQGTNRRIITPNFFYESGSLRRFGAISICHLISQFRRLPVSGRV